MEKGSTILVKVKGVNEHGITVFVPQYKKFALIPAEEIKKPFFPEKYLPVVNKFIYARLCSDNPLLISLKRVKIEKQQS